MKKKVSFDFDGTINDHFDGSKNPIKEEVKKFIKKLISEKFDVHIITRRHGEHNKNLGIGNEHEIVYKTAEELGIPKEKVIFTSRAWKKHTTHDIGIDIHIDDDSQDCHYINEQGKRCIAVCLESQHNPNNKNWQEYTQELLGVNVLNQREKERIELAKFIGYTFVEEDVFIDELEEHPLGTKLTVLSKVPIEVTNYESVYDKEKMAAWVKPFESYTTKYFKSLPNPDFGNEKSNLWNSSLPTLSWSTLNSGNYMHLSDWNPDADWNQLMEIITLIKSKTDEIFEISTDIELNFQRCLSFVKVL